MKIHQITSMSRGKIKIAVDENISALVPLLEKKGLTVLTPDKGMTDKQVCIWLNQQNVKAFFTCDYDDFSRLKLELKGGIVFGLMPWNIEFLAEIVDKIMQHSFSKLVAASKQAPGLITSPIVIGHDNYKRYTK